jgi:voltage-gated potassium channel
MIFLVFSTIWILIYEVKNHTPQWVDDYEFIAVIIFIIEWVSRVWIYSSIHETIIKDYEESQFLYKEYKLRNSLIKIIKKKFEFILSPISIVDLLAIIPYYRPLRVLRIFLLFRLIKVLRYTNSINQIVNVLKDKKFELYTLVLLYGLAAFFGSTVMYIYEGHGINEKIQTFFDAVYWSIITISTVGYGDITPVSLEGKIITTVLIGTGFLVLAFGTSIITTGLVARMEEVKIHRVISMVHKLQDYTIICSYGVTGRVLAGELNKINEKVVIIEQDSSKVHESQSRGFLTIQGDASNNYVLREAGISDGAKTICAITDDDAVNLSIALSAKTLNPSIKVIARANNHRNVEKFKLVDIDEVVSEKEIYAHISNGYLGQPVAFDAMDNILIDNHDGIVLEEVDVIEQSKFIGYKLSSLNISQFRLTLIGVTNASDMDNFIFNPKDNYIIKDRDIFLVIGYEISIKEFKSFLTISSPNKKA